MRKTIAAVVVAGVVSGVTTGLLPWAGAVDNAPSTGVTKDKILVKKSLRASKLTGLNVKNKNGDKLGSVNDFVINVESGKVSYVAMSHGGVAGIGSKLFAIPYQQLQFNHGQDEQFFVLDVAKNHFDNAPGFDKDNWPDMTNDKWWNEVDQFYNKTSSTKTTPAPKP